MCYLGLSGLERLLLFVTRGDALRACPGYHIPRRWRWRLPLAVISRGALTRVPLRGGGARRGVWAIVVPERRRRSGSEGRRCRS